MTITIADLRATLGLDTRPLERGVTHARAQGSKLQGQFAGLGRAIGGLFAGAAILKGFQSAVSTTVEWGTEVKSLTRNLGIAVGPASGLAVEAEHFGLSVEGLNKGLGIFEKHLLANDKQSRSLGIAFRDSRGELLPFDDILGKVADRFAKLPDGPQKTALALNLFGRSGRQLIPLLNAGSAGIAKFHEEARRLGLELTGRQLVAITQYKFAQRDLGAAFKGFEVQLGLKVIPTLTTLSTRVLIPLVETLNKVPAPVLAIAGAFGGAIVSVRLLTGVGHAVGAAFTTVRAVFTGLQQVLVPTTVATEAQAGAQAEAATTASEASTASEALAVELGKAAGFAQVLAAAMSDVGGASTVAAGAEAEATAANQGVGASALEAAIALQGEATAALTAADAEDVAAASSGGILAALGPLGIALGAATILIGIFARAHRTAQSDIDRFTQALNEEKRGLAGSLNTAIVEQFRDKFKGAFQDLAEAGPQAIQLAIKEIASGRTEQFQELEQQAGPLQKLLEKTFNPHTEPGKFVDIFDATKGIAGNLKDTKAEIDAVAKAADALGDSEALNKVRDQLSTTVELDSVLGRLQSRGLPNDIAEQFRKMGADGLTAAQQLNQADQQTLKDFIALSREANHTGDAVSLLQQHFSDLTAATEHFHSSLSATLGTTLNMQDVTARLSSDTEALAVSLNKNGHSFDLNTAKGRDNSQALRTVVGDIEDQITALVQSGKVTADDASQKAILLQKLRDLERKFPALKGQVDTYIAEVNKTPVAKTTTFKANTKPARDELASFLKTLPGKERQIEINARVSQAITGDILLPNVSVQSMNVAAASVTIQNTKGYMAGGFAPWGKLAMFGEQGPELGIPRPGGFDILTAPQTRAVLAGPRAGEGADMSRLVAAIGALTAKAGRHITNEVTVNYPRPGATEDALYLQLRKLTFLGVFG